MRVLENILLILNELLVLIGKVIKFVVLSITPRFVSRFFVRSYHASKLFFKKSWIFFLRKLALSVHSLDVLGTKFQNYAKESIENIGHEIQKEYQKWPGLFGVVKLIFLIPFKIVFAFFSVIISLILKLLPISIFIGLVAIICYQLRLFKVDDSKLEERLPNSIQESRGVVTRPVYHRRLDRSFEFKRLSIPVNIEGRGIGKGQYIIIDFSVETSNRYSKKFLSEHVLSIRDHLIESTEAELPSGPLTEEGGLILKEKIRMELNSFLEKNGVAGEILDIYFEALTTF